MTDVLALAIKMAHGTQPASAGACVLLFYYVVSATEFYIAQRVSLRLLSSGMNRRVILAAYRRFGPVWMKSMI